MNDIFKLNPDSHLPNDKRKLSPPQILAMGFIAVIFSGAVLLSLSISTSDGMCYRVSRGGYRVSIFGFWTNGNSCFDPNRRTWFYDLCNFFRYSIR